MDDSKTQSGASHDQSPAGDAPVPPQGGSTPPINEGANPNCGKRKRSRILRDAPRWVEMACAVALVGITGTYTYYAGGQLCEMRKATEATGKAADAAVDAAAAAKRANEITQHVFEATLGDFGVANLSRQSVGWAIKNSGKTSAEKVRWNASLRVTNLSNGTVVQSESLSSPPFNIKEGDPPFVYVFPLSDIAGRNLESESFKIDVSIAYENGFGKELSQSFCREIIGREQSTPSLDFGVYECFAAEPYRNKRIRELHTHKKTQ